MMNTQTKEQYAPPKCEEIEASLEGVISASIDPSNPFGGNTEETWG